MIEDVIIHGQKDGIHLGRGKRFVIRDCVFQTFDDAIALNGHDYSTSNPELGWIEDGVIENCHDLNQDNTTGYFCRILAGSWTDWRSGMSVQQSDTVVSSGRLYRVQAGPDGTIFTSTKRPTHASGQQTLDGIRWGVVQNEVTYTAGVRNVVFRDITLAKPRVGFSVHFDNNRYSRSVYPGSPPVIQRGLRFEHVQVRHDKNVSLFSIATPVEALTISSSTFGRGGIRFRGNNAVTDYLPTQVNLIGCTFSHDGPMELLKIAVPEKQVTLKSMASVVVDPGFLARVAPGPGDLNVESDLPGLQNAAADSDASNP